MQETYSLKRPLLCQMEIIWEKIGRAQFNNRARPIA